MVAQSKPVATLSPWGRAMAGASGAVLANALVYPLDIVKTRLQVQVKARPSPTASDPPSSLGEEMHYTSTWDAISKIVAEEGLSGLYAGMNASLVGVASTNFAYFYWYSIVRTLYVKTSKVAGPPSTFVELSLGATAGAIAQLFTIPVAVVTTRQQTQHKCERKGFFETAREVIDGDDGFFGLWRGLKASLVLVVNPAITYGAYERLKDSLFPGKKNLRPWEAFVLGSMSKALATIVTQPLIVAKVGLQSRPPRERQGRPFSTFGEVMKFIVDREGPSGLFKGIGPQILKGLLVQGILMMSKERMELMLLLFMRYIKTMHVSHLNKLSASRSQVVQHVAQTKLLMQR
ncbi:peroxisomal adenine nucleotide transporter 1 [Sodiomyces alkalinus F11]|uniref:Peroxisomal adenine nucleotide transporter 1 n=1 Tax=Sodiomyces alkalinus (strain CBS 110278 / VKM F-3762 / F11) TaxID=1314773 RepID=A0A3N2PWF4_SODAK|nr:peroxisomal adenine nucleotide transporter 1 [Sodiomyces alkalinus F11]ROT38859.1 peroxisomal adenine nucleotide transporter 1 [Sodiomyces alkalinus F11]